MPATLIDSNVLLAARNEDASQHDAARRIVGGIDRGEFPPAHVTDYVLAEVLNLLHARGHHRTGVDTYERLDESAGFELHHTTQGDFAAGVERYSNREQLSFVDGILVGYMERTGIEFIYTFDGEFAGVEGISRLDAPVDPYE